MNIDGDAILFLLALGPASAAGFYWAIYRHYRNTDKSHAFEHETAVEVLNLTGAESDHKVDEIRGTRASRIQGDNAGSHRQRVQPMQGAQCDAAGVPAPDLEHLIDFLRVKSEATEDLHPGHAAVDAIRAAARHRLAVMRFSFRKAVQNLAQRALIIPFGSTGYVSLYEIVSPSNVVVLAVHHQRSEDYP